MITYTLYQLNNLGEGHELNRQLGLIVKDDTKFNIDSFLKDRRGRNLNGLPVKTIRDLSTINNDNPFKLNLTKE